MKKVFKKIYEVIALLLGVDCEARRQAVDNGICDFGGQGRNNYGL